MAVWVDGVEGAGVPAEDPGFTLGMSVFDTARSYGLAPFRLGAHLDRLYASAAGAGIPTPDRGLLEAEIAAGLLPDAVIRVALTAGGHRVLSIRPVDPGRIGRPLRVARVSWPAVPGMPDWIKRGSRMGWLLAARSLGVEELLLVRGGRILEASRSSVIAAIGGVLVTPPLTGEQLASVTRAAMLDAAAAAGLPVEEAPLPAAGDFDELYLASTLKELAPVSELDGLPGPGGGPCGEALHAAFRELVREEIRGRSGRSAP